MSTVATHRQFVLNQLQFTLKQMQFALKQMQFGLTSCSARRALRRGEKKGKEEQREKRRRQEKREKGILTRKIRIFQRGVLPRSHLSPCKVPLLGGEARGSVRKKRPESRAP